MVITARERDIGGFFVRRLLPFAQHRMVGPFIFFDHMGPADFQRGTGMDVRPHPHIHLATVTYLFAGSIHHRDSLGSDQLINPGDINWMTAGRGIVHSERTPASFRRTGGKMNGIQCWVALPTELEEIQPSFKHHPSKSLPVFNIGDAQFKLLLGKSLGHQSPAQVHSELFYLEGKIPKGASFTFPTADLESAVYVVSGELKVNGKSVDQFSMFIGEKNEDLKIEAGEDSLVMLLGGAPVGERVIYWNFVSTNQKSIDDAKVHWMNGPTADNPRFPPIPGDSSEFIPLPKV